MVTRRQLVVRAGLAAGAAAVAGRAYAGPETAQSPSAPAAGEWAAVRAQFDLAPGLHHLAGFVLAPHPRPVRDAIERHRRGLDENPVHYLHEHGPRLEAAVLRAAAAYLGARPTDIALTDSTTMGLGLLYGGLRLRPARRC